MLVNNTCFSVLDLNIGLQWNQVSFKKSKYPGVNLIKNSKCLKNLKN